MTQLRKIERTCSACPSQWEGETVDGRCVYVRFRHGELSMGVADSIDEAVKRDTLIWISDDDSDGYMDDARMYELTGLVAAPAQPDAAAGADAGTEGE